MFSASALLSSATTLLFRVTGTSNSATALLNSATALLHRATTLLFCVTYRSVQCFGTYVQYCTIPLGTYCVASLSFIVTGLCRQTFI